MQEAARRIAAILREEIQQPFSVALDLGCRTGQLSTLLKEIPGIDYVIGSDMAERMQPDMVMDEEMIALAPESVNLIVSVLNLHWVNDLPGCLVQLHRILKPKGLLIASMFGGDTLKELNHAMREAEMETKGGISPHISPFALVKDAGRLLQRAGYHLPVADSDTITVMYPDATTLMHDLRMIGENNALCQRNSSFILQKTLASINQHYARLYGNEHGEIPASFEIITLTGWKD